MKKVLSILLALSFVVQPAYSVAQPAQAPKKGVITKAKEKWSAMKEAVKRGSAVLKANWQCITKGKGEKCSPDRYLALQIIRNFVKGNMKAAKEGLKKLFQMHKECWFPVLVVLIVGGFVTAAMIGDLFGMEAYEQAAILQTGTVLAGGVLTLGMMHDFISKNWKKIGTCMLVIGLDLPIVIVLAYVIYRLTYKHETSESRIDMPRTAKKTTLLHQAIDRHDLGRVEELLKKGANVQTVDEGGFTPFHWAVAQSYGAPYQQKEIMEVLLKHGAKINTHDKKGNTPLHLAAQHGRRELVQFLLDKGADANIQNDQEQKPVHLTEDAVLKQLLQPKLLWHERSHGR